MNIGETVKISSNIRESLQGIDEQKYEESNKINRFLMT